MDTMNLSGLACLEPSTRRTLAAGTARRLLLAPVESTSVVGRTVSCRGVMAAGAADPGGYGEAGLWSRAAFNWVSPLIRRGVSRELGLQDGLAFLSACDRSDQLHRSFVSAWQSDRSVRRPAAEREWDVASWQGKVARRRAVQSWGVTGKGLGLGEQGKHSVRGEGNPLAVGESHR